VAGAGAAAGVVGFGAGPAYGAVRSTKAARQTVIAYIDDPRGSEITLLVGEQEVVVQDRDLVTRILNAAGGE
jgi:hypothetical protein